MAYLFVDPIWLDKTTMRVKYFTKRSFDDSSSSTSTKSSTFSPFSRFDIFESLLKDTIAEYVNMLNDRKKLKFNISKFTKDPPSTKNRLMSIKSGPNVIFDDDFKVNVAEMQTILYNKELIKLNASLMTFDDSLKHPDIAFYNRVDGWARLSVTNLNMLKVIDTEAFLNEFRLRILDTFDKHRTIVNAESAKNIAKEAAKITEDADVQNLLKKLHDNPKEAEITLGKLIDQRLEARLKILKIPNVKSKTPSTRQTLKPAPKNATSPATRGRPPLRGSKPTPRGTPRQAAPTKKKEDKKKTPIRGSSGPRGRGQDRGRGRGQGRGQ